ncbi:Cullin-3 [Thecamonas trahens ATCC 50062]|uniref:Cullin-3 n=1 Tax=Thecamonas trahens ATCC 50062 TaxID=461836 RepID=A0A0L0DUS5_THETB|nr:Cullin-3 [Thecamonas trahens ATCC 50062]KNC55985.1 Cullin-3 [Thecamonas trahens ATCC 50062]|eukprot:XP_013761031.1 Cullin-3 [Thecamonas trahens ATCC 50062]
MCRLYEKVEVRLAEEVDRVARYLHHSTLERLTKTCETVMVAQHIDKIQAEFPSMLTQDKQDDLRRLYNLLARIENGLGPLRDIFRNHVRDDGLARIEALNNVNDDDDDGAAASSSTAAASKDEKKKRSSKKQEFKSYVETLIAVHDRYWSLIVNVFAEDNGFAVEMNKAFDHFMNLEGNRSPEYLSLYIDDKLKKGAKGVTEDEKSAIIDKCLILFRRIEEKDMFERYYKNHLAKRLLSGRSASNDAEREVITKLKSECGMSFTHKLEGMFKDVQLSADIMDKFGESELAKNLGITLSVQVLTTGFWPQVAGSCILPPEIAKCQEVFKQFYLNSHSGRVLNWQSTQGTADLKATFGGKTKEISVSTTQMAILCLFNQADSMTFTEIRDATELDIVALKRDLLSLACAKYKILTKEPKSKKIKPDDVFTFNETFKCKLFKFKIPQVVTKESSREREVTIRKVDDDRKFKIDAAIVRIMKARKTLDHANLVAAVIKQLKARFTPNPPVIKKQIETLIERGYLERDPKSRKQYNYLA